MNKPCFSQVCFLVIFILNNSITKVYASLTEIDLCSSEISDSDTTGNGVKDANNTNIFYKDPRTQPCACVNPLTCVRKCCKPGFYLGAQKKCFHTQNYTKAFEIPVFKNQTTYSKTLQLPRNFVVGIINCSLFKLDNTNPDDASYVQETGELWVPTYNKFFANHQYCVDEVQGVSVFLCFEEETFSDEATSSVGQKLGRRVNVAGMIISMPFLLATFLVYAALPDRNLHQKALMFYVLSLLIAYILLVTIQLSQQQFETVPCKGIGFSTVFFFMLSFFWMNVICIDIWFTFSGSRGFIGSQRASERRRFLYYCIYAWCMSFLQVLIAVLVNEYGNQDADYHPGVGIAKCFIADGLPSLLYFYGQIAIITTVNIILFSLTAYKIRQVKKETSMLKQSDSKRHSYEKDKQKFNLYLKLLFAMGVNWSMELISWAVNWKMGNNIPEYVWYLTDFCNAMYGVFIFFIFVFKRKIWKQLQKRYYTVIGRPHLAHSLTTTRTTQASNYSSGNYSTAETGFHSDNRTTITDIGSTVNGTNNLRPEERPLSRR